jgi:molybdopterin/thiamine biosynthesis adenylyltransferase
MRKAFFMRIVFINNPGGIEEAYDNISRMRRKISAARVPARYARNIGTLGSAGQKRLGRSRVLIVGLGGLGGFVLESLCRLGVGSIVGVDSDKFEASNLNRQLLSEMGNLGKLKAKAAVERAAKINPDVEFLPIAERFETLAPEFFQSCDLAFDCLDTVPGKLELCRRCHAAGIPVVHGAIAGWCGQVALCPPGDELLQKIYQGSKGPRGAETRLGNLPITAATAAQMMVAAALPVLLGKPCTPGIKFFDLEWCQA